MPPVSPGPLQSRPEDAKPRRAAGAGGVGRGREVPMFQKLFSVYRGLPRGDYVLFLSRVVNNLGNVVMPLLALILTERLGFSKERAGLFTTLFIAAQPPFIMLGGWLCDRIGGKRVVILFDTLGALMYLVCACLRPSLTTAMLIALAACLYSGASAAFNSIVAAITPAEKINSAYSLNYLGMNLGFTVGPILSGLLFGNLTLLFVLDAVTTLAATGITALLLPVTPAAAPKESAQADAPRQPLWEVLRRVPVLQVFSAALLLYYLCYMQWSFLLPLQTAGLFGGDRGPLLYSFTVSINAVCVILLTPVLTHSTQRFASAHVIAAGGILYLISFLMFSVDMRWPLLFYAAAVVLTLGEILVTINTNSFIALRTPQTHLGRVNSLTTIVSGTGSALSPMLMGRLLKSVDFRGAWLCVAGVMALGVLSMGAVNRADRAWRREERP